jgi:amino-acid N-acetyltransferase
MSPKSPDAIEIGDGTAADRAEIVALLEAAALPLAGLEQAQEMIVARRAGRIVGSAALELYTDGALLRSVAVEAGLRRAGIGRRLVEAALERARELGVPAVYLLTVAWERYYTKFGFVRVDRAAVPDTVKVSVEFTSACPASALVMHRRIAPPHA